MRVTLMGSHSVWPCHRELGLDPRTIRRVTSWNETLATELALLPDLEVQFITSRKGDKTRTVKNGRLTITFLPASRWLNGLTGFGWTALRARGLIADFRPDLVHGIGTEHPWPAIALHMGWPSVITIHGVINRINECTQPAKFSKARYFGFWERYVFKRAREVIVISPYVGQLLAGAGSAARLHPVENPVARRFFTVKAHPQESRTLLFVGHTGHGKGFHLLVSALGMLKRNGLLTGWSIRIVGPQHHDAYNDRAVAEIKRHGLDRQIEFTGFQLPDAMAAIYREAAVLVLPSEQETAPMCVAEAMTCGVPVIATKVGGVPYMVSDGGTGILVDVDDALGLSSGLSRLILHPGLRIAMGELAAHLAVERWHPARVAERTLGVYRQVLDSAKNRA